MDQAPQPHADGRDVSRYVAPDLTYLGTLAELTQAICPPNVDPTGKETGAADGCAFLGIDIGPVS